jgi:hypothetical protein
VKYLHRRALFGGRPALLDDVPLGVIDAGSIRAHWLDTCGDCEEHLGVTLEVMIRDFPRKDLARRLRIYSLR